MTDIQAIKDRLDVVQIVGEYVSLKKAGANWKANCPFHHEKSPSFMVHPEKQIWHCFGCGKGGDVISFVQEMDGLEFLEALKLLAGRAGVEISFQKAEVNQSERNRLLEINSAAANFFHRFLLEISSSESARKYLEERGLKKQTILDWQIGYVPDQWDLLTKYLVKKGFGINDLVSAGLTIKRDSADASTGRGYYDRFRGRIMFPISDTHGNVIGFTGRVLVETENSGGKYVNTPQTILYDKSRVLYGIHRAKTEIKSKDLAVLVEGQMDVIACHQAGMCSVVAASGTALTIEQIKLLKRYSNNITMAFDSDNAGQNAGKRGIEVALEQGMNIKVIQIPEGAGKDADECLKKDPNVWFSAVKNAKGVMDWLFSIVLTKVDRKDFRSKQTAASALLEEINRIPHGVERDEWIKRLGEELSIDAGVLREEIKHIKSAPQKAPSGQGNKKPSLAQKSQLEVLVETFLTLLLNYPGQYGAIASQLRSEFFAQTSYLPLYELIKEGYNRHNLLVLEELKKGAGDKEGMNIVDLLLLKPVLENQSPDEVRKELDSLIQRIKDEWRKTRGQEIQRALAEAEKNKDKEKINALLLEMQTLQ